MISKLMVFQLAIAARKSLMKTGIGAADILKLRANNICTVATLLNTTTRRLLRIKGFSDAKVEKIKEAGKKLVVRFPKYLLSKMKVS